jgi:hypothetical protein
MSHNELPNTATSTLRDKSQSLPWRKLSLRILGGYVIYGLAYYYVDPSTMMDSGSVVKNIVGYVIRIFVLFSSLLVPTSLIALLIAKVPPKNRGIPLTTVYSRALIVAILISAVGLYFYSTAMKELAPPIKKEKVVSSGMPADAGPVVAAITIQSANEITVQNLTKHGLNIQSRGL